MHCRDSPDAVSWRQDPMSAYTRSPSSPVGPAKGFLSIFSTDPTQSQPPRPSKPKPIWPNPSVPERRTKTSVKRRERPFKSRAVPAAATHTWSGKRRRGQRLVEGPGAHRNVDGLGLLDWRDGWFDGCIAAERTADVFCEQVQSTVARSHSRGRVAIVMADNLKMHTSAGSLLVRSMLTELKELLRLVSTPASDPGAHRIEWLWRVSQRAVTHHYRRMFDLQLADRKAHVQTLTRTSAEILRSIGNPCASAHRSLPFLDIPCIIFPTWGQKTSIKRCSFLTQQACVR